MQGILITPVSADDERLARLQQRGTPVVLVDSRSPARGQCSVSVDDVLGGELAVAHLLEAGHARIAFVGGPLSIRQVADRREGAVRALERAGASAGDLHMIVTSGAERGRRAARRCRPRGTAAAGSGPRRSSARTTCSPWACCRR